MRIVSLTGVGKAIASNPEANPTMGTRILYFLKRHGERQTDDAITQYVTSDSGRTIRELNDLERAKAVTITR